MPACSTISRATSRDRYTVVAFDPRGNSRSPFTGEPGDLRVDVQADDAAAVISAAGSGPAYVFGTSGGGQIGLDLAARYPESVVALVAHEPPTTMLMDDPTAALAADRMIVDTYRREGVEAAMGVFFATNGLDEGAEHDGGPPDAAPTPEEAETFERVSGNFEYWLAHGMMPLSLYRPDVDALRAGRPRIIVGIGEESAGQVIHDMGMALAARLDTEPVVFPGDHMGFGPYAEAFAETLDRTFRPVADDGPRQPSLAAAMAGVRDANAM